MVKNAQQTKLKCNFFLRVQYSISSFLDTQKRALFLVVEDWSDTKTQQSGKKRFDILRWFEELVVGFGAWGKKCNASRSVQLYTVCTLTTTRRVTHIAQQIESKPHPRQMLKVSCMPHYTLNQFNEDINAIWQGYWTVDNLFTLKFRSHFILDDTRWS